MSGCKLETPNPSRKKVICPVTLREVAVGIFKGINPAHNIKTQYTGWTHTNKTSTFKI